MCVCACRTLAGMCGLRANVLFSFRVRNRSSSIWKKQKWMPLSIIQAMVGKWNLLYVSSGIHRNGKLFIYEYVLPFGGGGSLIFEQFEMIFWTMSKCFACFKHFQWKRCITHAPNLCWQSPGLFIISCFILFFLSLFIL